MFSFEECDGGGDAGAARADERSAPGRTESAQERVGNFPSSSMRLFSSERYSSAG